ncbi:MAG: hypothetical protein ACXAEI_18160 [Candidatus Hodarchaeales archaeon]|jgi:hypothetical protein
MTRAEDICQKISPSLAPEFFEGKRDVGEFEDLIQRLRDSGNITKDEYKYIRKNFRHIALGLQLFYLVPELYDERNTPTVFIQISSLMALRILQQGEIKSLEEAIRVLADQMRQTLGSPMSSIITADTVGDKIRQLKDEVTKLYQKEDIKEIQAAIVRVKDDIFETVGMSAILHEMNRYARELSKARLPDYYDIMQTLDEWAERADSM